MATERESREHHAVSARQAIQMVPMNVGTILRKGDQMSIRIHNTRTGRTIRARDGKDAALIVKIEQDRRAGAELAKADKQAKGATS